MTNAAKLDASDDQTTIRQRLLLNPVLLDFSNIRSIDEAILGKRGWRSHYYVNGAHCVRSYHPAIHCNPHLKFSASSVPTSPHCHLGHVMFFFFLAELIFLEKRVLFKKIPGKRESKTTVEHDMVG